jgi:Zn-dependent protease
MIFGPLIGFTWFGNGDMILGWGRTVSVTTRNLKRITRDDNLIACAGPAANLLLALTAFVLLVILLLVSPDKSNLVLTIHGQSLLDGLTALQALGMLLSLTIQINLGLFFFNFVPIPPLDASRFVRNLLPYNSLETFDTIGRYGIILIFFLGRIVVGFFLAPTMVLLFTAMARILQHG